MGKKEFEVDRPQFQFCWSGLSHTTKPLLSIILGSEPAFKRLSLFENSKDVEEIHVYILDSGTILFTGDRTPNIDEVVDVNIHLDTVLHRTGDQYKNFNWPLDISDNEHGAMLVMGNKTILDDSRLAVRKKR